jgi:hypothetical protein
VYPIFKIKFGFQAIPLNHDWQSGREEVVECRAGELTGTVEADMGRRMLRLVPQRRSP